jgi:phosphohistidine phosphatase
VRLYLVRHAEAAPGDPDELRRLTPQGREQARALGQKLDADGARPGAILTSPLLRARETAELIARAAGLTPDADERLGPGATPEDLNAATSGRGDTVVAVGHQPDCSTIVLALTGRERAFAPGAVQELEL